ncbi:MAG: sigma-70 family RNA polymerase sigma factor [Actinomycetota bacterium]|nr:sigma-70 family RNA polymerase sigma factor [Actinomycetota bacterium]
MNQARLANLEDHDLVRQAADGDVQAFEAIYDRYSSQAFGVALRVTGCRRAAEEATQDAFVGVWRAARTYDMSRGTLKAWILSMVRNRSIDSLRRTARHNRDLGIDDARVGRLEAAERTEDQVASREESRDTRQLLLCLPTNQRQVIELAYFKGLTQTEIAEHIGAPLGTVKGRQRLALTKMHRTLTGHPELVLTR